MHFYNTLTRTIELFKPLDKNIVRVYTCGPTVYDHAHIGNLSTYIFADTLHRALHLAGYDVHRVMNYTDVDDKTIRRAHQEQGQTDPNKALHNVTARYIKLFLNDMEQVGNDLQDLTLVRATDYIEQMQALITQLVKGGFAYIADDGVYFSIDAYKKSGKTYGQLLKLTSGNTSAERIQNDEYDKDNVHDFALWKTKKEGEPSWEFQLHGVNLTGRPGWHIECSAMSADNLGQPFDIHTGGVDNIFPHHENEIAQSTALTKNPVFATTFMHAEHILVNGKKMAKSAKNFFVLKDVANTVMEALAFRLLVLSSHYRSQVNFSKDNLAQAVARLADFYKFAQLQHQPNLIDAYGTTTKRDILAFKDELTSSLFDDLNTALFLNKLGAWGHKIRKEKLQDQAAFGEFKRLITFVDEALGLQLANQTDITDAQKELLTAQDKAWKDARNSHSKDFGQVDAMKKKLANDGISVSNYQGGKPLWSRSEA
jgi:cysteinyl-tRNA synthetase